MYSFASMKWVRESNRFHRTDPALFETSGTRLGDFLKFLVTNNLQKVATMYKDFLGLSEKHHF